MKFLPLAVAQAEGARCPSRIPDSPSASARHVTMQSRLSAGCRRDPQLRPNLSLSRIDNMESRIRVEQAVLREAQARLAELRGGAAPTSFLLPYGFRTPEEFTRFGQMLHGGLRDAGHDEVQVFLRGGSFEGRNWRTREPFNMGRTSDVDIALASPVLFQRASDIGVKLRGAGTRTGELTSHQLSELGLRDLANVLKTQVGQPVTFMIYNSTSAVSQRGPSLAILGK